MVAKRYLKAKSNKSIKANSSRTRAKRNKKLAKYYSQQNELIFQMLKRYPKPKN